MASSSSSSSLGVCQSKHDVFLSFRGEDTRHNFTSHLHAALCRHKIDTFIDDKEIKKGDKISPTLLAAIESSKISIIIFSENYASSKWCLDELEKIVECAERKEHVMIPVFYHIDPSHVRHQRGSYGDAFAKHEECFKDNLIKVQKWRTALREAANSAGWDSSNVRLESELVEQIVGDVLQKLYRMYPHVQKRLVGIATHIANMESMFTRSTEVGIFGIWGMGGVGKTTIAGALYEKLSSKYEGCCFVDNVREEWKNHREKDLRNKLLTEVLGDQNLNISTHSMSSSTFVKGRLQHKKLLIVLDDVADSKQIEYLIGGKYWCGPGSRIIVTTRDIDVLIIGVDGVYRVGELDFIEALELFSLNAFKQDRPKREYRHLCERAVDYCTGIPLALIVLGSSLYSKSPTQWESALEKLKKIPRSEIHDVLRWSYDGLDPEEKDIFLDIACCWKGEKIHRITSLLDGCGFSTDIGIQSLYAKSLITISKKGRVKMHDLIQEMGWQIVKEESMKMPGERSRLWDPEDIYEVLKYDKGTEHVESIMMDMSQIKDVTVKRPQVFSRMYKLRFLNFYLPSCDKRSNVDISEGLESMPDELTYLRWDCFPLKSLPQHFSAKKLVELDLKHSLIEKLWGGRQDLVNLKSLYLSGCKHLIELPDLSLASKLEELHLDDCTSLSELPDNLGLLSALNKLSLRGSNIETLPCSINDLSKLRALDVSECRRLRSLPILPLLLQDLNASGCISLETISTSEITKWHNSFGGKNGRSLFRQIQEEGKMSVRHHNYLGRFDFFNCKRLDQNALKTVLDEALIRIIESAYISAMIEASLDEALIRITESAYKSAMIEASYDNDPYHQSEEETQNSDLGNLGYITPLVCIILPGSVVPEWFQYQSPASVFKYRRIDSQCPCYFNYSSFAFCLVLGPSHSNKEKKHLTSFKAWCKYSISTFFAGSCSIEFSCNDAESDQVLLWYDSIRTEYSKGYIFNFEFFVEDSSGFVVKRCGVQPLYAPSGKFFKMVLDRYGLSTDIGMRSHLQDGVITGVSFGCSCGRECKSRFLALRMTMGRVWVGAWNDALISSRGETTRNPECFLFTPTMHRPIHMVSASSFHVLQSEHADFASYFYDAVCGNKINIFIDDKEIKEGDQRWPALPEAIERWKISLTVLDEEDGFRKNDLMTAILECYLLRFRFKVR